MKLLLVGSRYYHARSSGDKNFWFELVKHISPRLNEIHILSLEYTNYGTQFYEPNVWIHRMQSVPFPSLRTKRTDSVGRFYTSYVSQSLSFMKAVKEIKELCRKYEVDIIQLRDNYGPAMLLLPLSGLKLPLSALVGGYYPGFPGYRVMLKLLGRAFTKIVPTTEPLRQKLQEIGISDKHLSQAITWGVPTSDLRRSPQQREVVRGQLGISPESTLVIWTGFLQQTSFQEFRYSMDVALEVLNKSDSCHFIFCFKHGHFKEEFTRFSRDRVNVIRTESNEYFLKYVNAADILLSPYLAKNAILTPPLTWLECMAYEVPVVTTTIADTGELVNRGRGYVAHSKDDMADFIVDFAANDELRRAMGAKAREFVCRNYDIAHVANRYVNLWHEMKDEEVSS